MPYVATAGKHGSLHIIWLQHENERQCRTHRCRGGARAGGTGVRDTYGNIDSFGAGICIGKREDATEEGRMNAAPVA